jgi:hypothetical protein
LMGVVDEGGKKSKWCFYSTLHFLSFFSSSLLTLISR